MYFVLIDSFEMTRFAYIYNSSDIIIASLVQSLWLFSLNVIKISEWLNVSNEPLSMLSVSQRNL